MFLNKRIWILLSSILLQLLILALTVKAQDIKRPVRIITTKNGLPQSFISGLIQDENGFVWIGTRNGLARFDGHHFKLFRRNNKDTNTISSNVIISIKEKNGKILIEHESSQIDIFDPFLETVKRLTAHPLFKNHPSRFARRGWVTDTKNNLWCVNIDGGLTYYDWKHQSVRHYNWKIYGFSDDKIHGLLLDKYDRLWIVSQHSISQFNKKTGTFIHTKIPFELDFNPIEDSSSDMIAVNLRSNQEIMFGDCQKLIFYNTANESFRTVDLPMMAKNGVSYIQTGPDSSEYITSLGIVYRYDQQQGLIAVGDIGNDAIRDFKSFLVDRSGLIWIGTNAAGIHQIDLNTPFFDSRPTKYSFHQDIFKDLLHTAFDKFSGWPLENELFSSSSYFIRSAYDKNKVLWIGARDRVGYYNAALKKFTMLPHIPGIAHDKKYSFGIRGIGFSEEGEIWVIGYNGYVGSYNPVSRSWVTFLNSEVMKTRINPDLTLIDLCVVNGKLWITTGSGDGLLSVNISSKEISQFSQKTHPKLFPTNLLLGMEKDPNTKDFIWIGTYEGLVRLNIRTLKSTVFTVEDGLPDNTIYSLQTDNSGYLWLSTNKGLCRFSTVSHQLQVFQSADGLPGDEFNRFHHLKLPDGRLAFGGTEGWTIFNPTAMKVDRYNPKVAFTVLKVNNVLVNANNPILTEPLNSLHELQLPFDQNSLTFEFAGLEYNRPDILRYRYQLVGYDEKWLTADNQPIANFTKLPAGHYTLKINSSNTTGQWSPYIRELAIVINPPVWQTWWAYILYFVLAMLMVRAYIRYLINKAKLGEQVALQLKEAEQLKELDRIKTRFFSNITHEFRTPLTLILTPAQLLKPTLLQNDQTRWLSAIEGNARLLLRLINQLLDLSKLESGSMKLQETLADIGIFTEDLIRPFQLEAEVKGIVLTYENRLSGLNYWFDQDKLERIISNLISNAIKFTPEYGNVKIALSPVETDNISGGIYLTVTDNGIGIAEEELPYIFNRFYQIGKEDQHASAFKQQGSGIGLSLVKELVDLQNGTIRVTSQDRQTCFMVMLPFKSEKKHINETEKLSENLPYFQEEPFKFKVRKGGNYQAGNEDALVILVVEDNLQLAEFIGDSLGSAYRIVKAVNGQDGLNQAINIIPDIIISDVMMPVMDGFELCNYIKNDLRTGHIPFILLTAKGSFEDRIEGLSLGADDYLIKPFHIQELQLRVNNQLERSSRLRENLRHQLGTAENSSVISSTISKQKEDPFVQKLYLLFEQNLDNTAFGIEDIASQTGLSRTSLYRKVKALTGMSTVDILKNYRLKSAADFLKLGFSSSETAYKTGFDSPAYFSKCFRDFYKLTPNEFIQKML